MHLLVLSLLLFFANACISSRPSPHEDAGFPASPEDGGEEDGGRTLLESVSCSSTVQANGLRAVQHQVSFYEGGRVLARCSVGSSSAAFHGSASYRFGEVGSQGGVCFVDVDVDVPSNGYWRFQLPQDHSQSIVTYVDSSSPVRPHEWLIPCLAQSTE